jgi:hypothetical protein
MHAPYHFLVEERWADSLGVTVELQESVSECELFMFNVCLKTLIGKIT